MIAKGNTNITSLSKEDTGVPAGPKSGRKLKSHQGKPLNAPSGEEEPIFEGTDLIELPIDGVLDLHTFRPCDVKEVLLEYITQCQARKIFEMRVIHGKGSGQLRRSVQAILARHPAVATFAPASELYGGAGATLVRLARIK